MLTNTTDIITIPPNTANPNKSPDKKTYKLNKDYVMSLEDIKALESLPDNLPDTKLTKKQIELQDKIQPVRDSSINPKIKNNDKCPCNSGNKYKKCCKK